MVKTIKLFNRVMTAWLAVSFVFWTWYLSFIEFNWQFIYFYVIILLVGGLFWFRMDWMKKSLAAWKLNPFLKFALLGYGTVLFEEIFAALFNNLSEGFAPQLFLLRISQFWAFNVFAFTGFIIGWYFILRRYKYSYPEVFYLSGAFGLFGERVLTHIFVNPLAAFFFAPVAIFVYGVVITPAFMSLRETGDKNMNPVLKYVLTIAVMFAFSVLPLLILWSLRTAYPGMFPPPEFIPL